MGRGFAFPNLPKLEQALVERGWTREVLSERTGLHPGVVSRAVAGKPVAIETIERIAEALLAHPPDTALARFLREDSA